jgi:hypothetical protein
MKMADILLQKYIRVTIIENYGVTTKKNNFQFVTIIIKIKNLKLNLNKLIWKFLEII